MKKNVVIFLCLLFVLLTSLSAIDPIKFRITSLKYGPASGPSMFSTVSAYAAFFKDAGTGSSCLEENLDFVEGLNGLTTEIDLGTLSFFENINTVVADGEPNAANQAGDRRIYTEAVGYIKLNGITVLKASNIFISMDVSYPTPYGADSPTTGHGLGEIVAGESNADWLAYFDPNGTGQVHFDFTSFSPIVQGNYGTYNCDYILRPTQFRQFMRMRHINVLHQEYNFTDTGLSLNFSAINQSHPNSYWSNNFIVNRIETKPEGALPSSINRITPIYWEIGSSAYSFTTDIQIDLNTLTGISNTNNLRVLYRKWDNASWEIVSSIVESNYLKITASTAEGQYTIGTIGDDTLPVELSSFNAILSGSEYVQVNWSTESESNMIGYHILRSNNDNIDNSTRISSSPVQANNNSSTNNYHFRDNEIEDNATYYYWLNAINQDGSSESYGPVSIFINPTDDTTSPDLVSSRLDKVYPNPLFKSDLTINYKLAELDNAQIQIFNVKGQKIEHISNLKRGEQSIKVSLKNLSSGIYFVRFESDTQSSIRKFLVIH